MFSLKHPRQRLSGQRTPLHQFYSIEFDHCWCSYVECCVCTEHAVCGDDDVDVAGVGMPFYVIILLNE